MTQKIKKTPGPRPGQSKADIIEPKQKNPSNVQYMTIEQKKEIASIVIEFYSEGNRIDSCCAAAGISSCTYYNWLSKEEFKDEANKYNALREGRHKLKVEQLKPIAYKGAKKLLAGYQSENKKMITRKGPDGEIIETVEETSIVDNKPSTPLVVYFLSQISGNEGFADTESAGTGGGTVFNIYGGEVRKEEK